MTKNKKPEEQQMTIRFLKDGAVESWPRGIALICIDRKIAEPLGEFDYNDLPLHDRRIA